MAPECLPRILFPEHGLVGDKVVLKWFCESDISERYLGWLNDPRVVEFSNQRFRKHDRQSAHAYLSSFDGTDNLFLSVRERNSGEAIGTMTVYVSRHHQTADVGIMLGAQSVWGRGYGQDAWATLVDWLIDEVGLRKVTAGTLACNKGMVKLMERSGMLHEATRRQQELVNGRPEDIVYHARFRPS